MSYTTQKNKDDKWEVRLGGKLVFTTELEEAADDMAICLGAARRERIMREASISTITGKA